MKKSLLMSVLYSLIILPSLAARERNAERGVKRAVAAFVGTVRDVNDGAGVSTLTLEHYPGMTERALGRIADQAHARFRIEDCLVVHRVGPLRPQDQIVLVAVTSAHRGDHFGLASDHPALRARCRQIGDRQRTAVRSDYVLGPRSKRLRHELTHALD